jgi:hypothetical protein
LSITVPEAMLAAADESLRLLGGARLVIDSEVSAG